MDDREESAVESDSDSEPEPLVRQDVAELVIILPRGDSAFQNTHLFEQVLLILCKLREPLVFELIANESDMSLQFAGHPRDLLILRNLFTTFHPNSHFLEGQGKLSEVWSQAGGQEALIFELGLARASLLQLLVPNLPGGDPLAGVLAALSDLRAGEIAVYQVMFAPVRQPWAANMVSAVTDHSGGELFVNAPDLLVHAKRKASALLYAVVVRVAVKALTYDRTIDLSGEIAGALSSFADPNGNELIPLHNRDYPFEAHEDDLLNRQSRRSGMLLSSEELLGFVHFPSASLALPKLSGVGKRTKASPSRFSKPEGVLLGRNEHGGRSVDVFVPFEGRVRHTYLLGASGTGKSTLLLNLIRQDIERGHGFAVIDPHGDLIDQILRYIPPTRIDDVVLLDPGDADYSVGFNVLTAHSEIEKNLLASDLVSIFQRLSTSWGDQLGSVFKNAILAFLESPGGGTLADLRRFLIEPEFRKEIIARVSDPDVVYYWSKTFPLLSGNRSVGPVLTRLDTFLAPKPIRFMVSQPENKLDFSAIMNSRKIFLAKLSQGIVGKENSFLLGSLLMAKFQQTAMARQAVAAPRRFPYFLYADEFHEYISPSLAEIISGARKYNVGLVLAHQEMHQLERVPEVASAVRNAFTSICFRVGDHDARSMEKGFSFFKSEDLQSLGTGEAICRLERADFDFNLSVMPPEAPSTEGGIESIIESSRRKYALHRSQIHTAQRTAIPPVELKQSVSGTNPGAPKKSAIPQDDKQRPRGSVQNHDAEISRSSETEPELRDMGIGGAQHQALQQRIKKFAEEIGLGASIEEQILNRQGSVDVLLQGKGQRIACEISVTTTVDHEVGNVRKCLKAGFQEIAVISTTNERLSKIRTAIDTCMSSDEAGCVSYYLPEEFLSYLETRRIAATAQKEAPLKLGKYRVVTQHDALTAQEAKDREDLAVKSVARAMARRKRKT